MSRCFPIALRWNPLPLFLLLALALAATLVRRAPAAPPACHPPHVVAPLAVPAVVVPFTFATYSDPQKDLAKRVEVLEKQLKSLQSARAGRIPPADSAVFRAAVQAKCQTCHSPALAAEVGGGFVLPGVPSELSAAKRTMLVSKVKARKMPPDGSAPLTDPEYEALIAGFSLTGEVP